MTDTPQHKTTPPRPSSRNRATPNPGGMQYQECDEIFIGDEGDALCAICWWEKMHGKR